MGDTEAQAAAALLRERFLRCWSGGFIGSDVSLQIHRQPCVATAPPLPTAVLTGLDQTNLWRLTRRVCLACLPRERLDTHLCAVDGKQEELLVSGLRSPIGVIAHARIRAQDLVAVEMALPGGCFDEASQAELVPKIDRAQGSGNTVASSRAEEQRTHETAAAAAAAARQQFNQEQQEKFPWLTGGATGGVTSTEADAAAVVVPDLSTSPQPSTMATTTSEPEPGADMGAPQ
jgi:hypothetical protein